MSTIAIRYDVDPTLSIDRQIALTRVYSTTLVFATVERDLGHRYTARDAAEQCRRLIAAFGVRRTRRHEISEARLAELRGELAAKIAARIKASAQ